MADLINLRNVRKRAKRLEDDAQAQANRHRHGQPKRLRQLADAQKAKVEKDLEGHRIEPGDGR